MEDIKNNESEEDFDIDECISNEDDDISFISNANTNKNTNKSLKKSKLSKLKKDSLDCASAYNVITDADFTSKCTIPYRIITDMFERLSKTSKRLEKVSIISNLLRSVFILRPQELLAVIYLCSNTIAPAYHGIELGVGDFVIIRALSETCGRSSTDMKKELIKIGDLGLVAQNARSKQKTLFKPRALTVIQVFNTLLKVASTSGTKSQTLKVRLIQKLFVAATSVESKYLVRHLQGKMRIGVNEQTVLASIGRACAFTPANQNKKGNKWILDTSEHKSDEEMNDHEIQCTSIIKQVIGELPNYNLVIPKLMEHGLSLLHSYCHLTAGIPIKVMLAKPTKGVEEILKRFSEISFTLEYKYDGERAQIHLLSNGEIFIYSRNGENNTAKYPDLIANVRRYIKPCVQSFIIDSEVVAYDRISAQILPFQKLTTRKRKDVNECDIDVQVCIYAFDCLLINDKPLIHREFQQRRKTLHQMFLPVKGEFQFAHFKDYNPLDSNADEISQYLNEAVDDFCEGLMVKTLVGPEATYEPSKRSVNWLKCKKDYLDGIGDTLDLCVMGAFHGSGKRTGFYGSYLVGCYSTQTQTFQSCCKVGTGLTDHDLKRMTHRFKLILLAKKPMEYETGMECEVWFQPKYVWEIKCADLSISPTHLAAFGMAHDSKGIGLRFPRFIRDRDDKKCENATSAEQIYEMYCNQAQIVAAGDGKNKNNNLKRFR